MDWEIVSTKAFVMIYFLGLWEHRYLLGILKLYKIYFFLCMKYFMIL